MIRTMKPNDTLTLQIEEPCTVVVKVVAVRINGTTEIELISDVKIDPQPEVNPKDCH